MYRFILLLTAFTNIYAMEKKSVTLSLTNQSEKIAALIPKIRKAIYQTNPDLIKTMLNDLTSEEIDHIKDPLVYEATRYGVSMVTPLVQKKFSVNQSNEQDKKSERGWTPIMLAASINDEATVNYLLSNDANVNQESNDGSTPLIEATRCALPNMISLLLEHGADINAINNNGESAMTLAQGYKIQEILDILHAHKQIN